MDFKYKLLMIFSMLVMISGFTYASNLQTSDGSAITVGSNLDLGGNNITNVANFNGVYYVDSVMELENLIDMQISDLTIYLTSTSDYVLSGELKLPSGTKLVGNSVRDTVLDCSGLAVCIKGSDNVRTYNWNLQNIYLKGDDTVGSRGLDFTNQSTGYFSNIKIESFNYGLFGAGLNYYNDFYHLDISSSDFGVYLDNSSNENHFFGGTVKSPTTYHLYINDSNNNLFSGFSWENTASDGIYLTSTAESNGFFNNRFEFSSTTDVTFEGNFNSVIGGREQYANFDIVPLTYFMTEQKQIQFGTNANSVPTFTITGTGSGKSDANPSLLINETYTSSGTPTSIKVINPRFTGYYANWTFISGGVPVSTFTVKAQNGDIYSKSISEDGAGKVVCINADKTLGTCSDAVGVGGTCSCS